MNRREALGRVVLACASLALPGLIGGAAGAESGPEPSGILSFRNVHTGERCRVRYRDGEAWLPEGLEELSRLFRCHHTGEIHPIAPELFDLLDRVQVTLGRPGEPYELVSGYRSPRYNELLRRNGRGVARRSYHLRGMAADVRLPGVSLRDLRRAAQRLGLGGVGAYREFVHLDVGPVRYWRG